MEFNELLELCRAEALRELLDPTEDSVWRKICRSYSVKYSTPLHEVMKIDPEFVIKTYYASNLDDVNIRENLENITENIQSLQDPNYYVNKEKAFDEEIKRIEEKEKKRLASGDKIGSKKKGSKKTLPKEIESLDPELPKSGFINFAHLNEKNEQ